MQARGTGSLIKKKGSRFYYGQIFQDGKQRTISLKTDKKAVAERRLREAISKAERYESCRSTWLRRPMRK